MVMLSQYLQITKMEGEAAIIITSYRGQISKVHSTALSFPFPYPIQTILIRNIRVLPTDASKRKQLEAAHILAGHCWQ